MDFRITIIIGATLFSFVIVLFIFSFIIKYQKRSISFQSEKKLMKTQFQQELLQTQIEIQEQTLKNISEEIHDNVGQILSLAKLHLNTFPADTQPAMQLKLDETKSLVTKAINDLRNLSRTLHGDKINDIGLQEAIQSELNILKNTGEFITRLVIKGEPFAINSQKEMVLFRIVQEALHNAEKHSQSPELWVEMEYLPYSFILSVCDSGNGFDTLALQAVQKGIGLRSMQNRAALIGGKFTVRSGNGQGTCIQVELAACMPE